MLPFKIRHQRTADCVVAGYRLHKSGDTAVGRCFGPVPRRRDAGVRWRDRRVPRWPAAVSSSLSCNRWRLGFDGHPWAWANETAPRAGSRAGTPVRTFPSSRSDPNLWSRSATTTWRRRFRTPPSSTGGGRTATRVRAPSSSWRSHRRRASTLWFPVSTLWPERIADYRDLTPVRGPVCPSPSADLHRQPTDGGARLVVRPIERRRFLIRIEDLDDRTLGGRRARQLADLAAIGDLGRGTSVAVRPASPLATPSSTYSPSKVSSMNVFSRRNP